MQAVKILILGEFWDSQLYKDTLYLFDIEGSLRVVDWRKLVTSFSVPSRCALAMECAFLRSDYLYSDKWERLFEDFELQQLLQSKFSELLQQNLQLTEADLSKYTKDRADSPFPYAHNESLFYRDYLYVTSQSGVYAQMMTGDSLSRQPADRSWDASVSGIDATLDVLALAAGDNGLFRAASQTYFEYPGARAPKPEQLEARLCNDCSYIRTSILASAPGVGATLTEIKRPRQQQGKSARDLAHEYLHAHPLASHEVAELFERDTTDALVWGSGDRICMARGGLLQVIRYLPFRKYRRALTERIADVPLAQTTNISLAEWKGTPVSGDNAVFGSILELDNCLVIARSDNNVDTLKGEPVSWRVFAKSRHYTNQLHVVYEDRIEILSFNHDYFVEQRGKKLGEPHKEGRSWR
jgi:hypothetical protein